MGGKGLSDSGSGTNANVLAAVAACAEAGAKVISMSLGGGSFSAIAQEFYKDIYDQDILIVAAAGNAGNSGNHYPASYPHLMSVAAVDVNENKASFSVFNSQTEIAAPGVQVKSTVTQPEFSYASWSGTSMACPHVAGVAAKLWSHFPECKNSQIRNVLVKTSKDKGDPGCDTSYGYGIVKLKAAYDLLLEEGCSAGGAVTNPLSLSSFGGCEQDPDYTQPPTEAPAPCVGGKVLEIKILTDNYGHETSWSLKKDGVAINTGSGYESRTEYYDSTCLPQNECYEFEIIDAYGDGICCGYGSGLYELILDGEIVFSGGEFTSSETTQICVEGESNDACKDWCYVLEEVPWTSTVEGSTQRCDWHEYCAGCPECNNNVWESKALAPSQWTGRYVTYGAMFDVKAKNTIRINQLSAHIYYNKVMTVKVYTKPGSYKDNTYDIDSWELLYEGDLSCVGKGEEQKLPEFENAVEVAGGETQSFYVTTDERYGLYFSKGDQYAVDLSNEDVEIYSGAAIVYYPHPDTTFQLYEYYKFPTSIYYSVEGN